MNQAVWLTGPRGEITVAAAPPTEPGSGEVTVRMEACGICHSDVMIAGLEKLPLSPVVLGHEGIGVVESIGAGVSNVATGERVGITYLASGCGACEACREGRVRFCLKQGNHGFTRHGALTQVAVVAAQNLIRVPDELTAEEAAPLCCAGWTAYGAVRESGIRSGQLLAVFGFGGLGHLALPYARNVGARVAVVDISEEKLDFARSLGADSAVRGEDARNTLIKGYGGADAAIVFTASAAAVPLAFSCLKRGGTLVLVGMSMDTFSFSMTEVVLKGIRIQGSYLGTRADLEHVFTLAAAGVAKPHVQGHPLQAAPELIGKLRRGELVGRAVVRF